MAVKWKILDLTGFAALIEFIKNAMRTSNTAASDVSGLQEDIQGLADRVTSGFRQADTALQTLDSGKAGKDHTHTAEAVGALPITGGTVTGRTTYTGGLAVTKAENNSSMEYFLGIKAFAAGGDVQWIAKSDVCADIGAAKKPLFGSVTIPTTGWGSDSTATYPKYYDIAVTGVTASDRANVDIATASMSTATACGFCPVTETLAGKIRIRAAIVPAAALTANYWIEKGA